MYIVPLGKPGAGWHEPRVNDTFCVLFPAHFASENMENSTKVALQLNAVANTAGW
jgi:hypothetical protein